MTTYLLNCPTYPNEFILLGEGLGLLRDISTSFDKPQFDGCTPFDISFLGQSAARLIDKLFDIPRVTTVVVDSTEGYERLTILTIVDRALAQQIRHRIITTISRHLNIDPTNIPELHDSAELLHLLRQLQKDAHLIDSS